MAYWRDTRATGDDATQPTGTEQPTWIANSTGNGKPAIQFIAIAANPNRSLTLPTSVAFAAQGHSVYAVARGTWGNDRTGAYTSGNALTYLTQSGGAGNLFFYGGMYNSATTGTPVMCASQGGTDKPSTQLSTLPANFAVLAYRSGGSNLKYNLDAEETSTTPVSGITLAGGSIGNAIGIYPLQGEIQQLLIFNSALSDGDDATLTAWLYEQCGTQQPTKQTLWFGDSNMAGQSGSSPAPFGYAPPNQAWSAGLLQPTTKTTNCGIEGYTAQLLATAITNLTALENNGLFGSTGQASFVSIGSNDAANGTAATTIEGYLTTIATTLKNYHLQPILCGILPRNDGGGSYNATITAVNTWMAANYATIATAYMPVPAALTDPTNTTYYQSDEVHLTPTGLLVWATAMVNALVAATGEVW